MLKGLASPDVAPPYAFFSFLSSWALAKLKLISRLYEPTPVMR